MKKKSPLSKSVRRLPHSSSLSWRLKDVKHTGRLLHRHHTSYPALLMIFLCTGVLIAVNSRLVAADSSSYLVTASYLGQPPTSAPTIVTPGDGQHFTSRPIIISGSCPLNTSVSLTRNNIFSGAALCSSVGTYVIQTDLFNGANTLVATAYSRTNMAGPSGSPSTVYFDTPAAVISPLSTVSPARPVVSAPILLQTSFQYASQPVNRPLTFNYSVSGGQAPYAISVSWGDGTQNVMTVAASGSFALNHTYTKASGNNEPYRITVTVGDAKGSQTMLQVFTIVTELPAPIAANHNRSVPPSAGVFGGLQSLLPYAWYGYALLLLMMLCFWLGELRELRELHQARSKPGRPRHV